MRHAGVSPAIECNRMILNGYIFRLHFFSSGLSGSWDSFHSDVRLSARVFM